MKKNTTNTLSLRLLAERLCERLHQFVEKMSEHLDESGWYPGMRYRQPRA